MDILDLSCMFTTLLLAKRFYISTKNILFTYKNTLLNAIVRYFSDLLINLLNLFQNNHFWLLLFF